MGIMDYWISINSVQKGPYSLHQLQLMWGQGSATSDALYYDTIHSQWQPLRGLVENARKLFTVEEAFVRLGQNRLKGCLSVYNSEETINLFVDEGFVVCAAGAKEQGEFALSRALALEGSTYEWFQQATPPISDLRVNITEHTLKHSIARDVRIGIKVSRKQNTEHLPKGVLDKVEPVLPFSYLLVTNDAPNLSLKLAKMTSVLGREDHCDIVFPDVKVSRKHCLLEIWEQSVKIKDLDSSNGTYVNGKPVHDGFLNVGDKLSLGSYNLTLQKEKKRAPAMA